MKKVLVALLVVGLIMSIVGLVSASEYTLLQETQVWRWDEENQTWVEEPKGSVEANARFWHQGTQQGGFCNKETWTIDVATHASIAQWIKWELDAQGWNIKVRKPGIYVAGPIFGKIKSNADVLATASGFDDLKSTAPNSNEKIETWYGFSLTENTPIDQIQWVKATQVPSSVIIPYCEHTGYLWIKINVREDVSDGYIKTRACEYQDDATINLTVKMLKPWIDPSNGFFIGTMPEYPED